MRIRSTSLPIGAERVPQQEQVRREHHDERDREVGALDEREGRVDRHGRERQQQRRDDEQAPR